MAIKGEKRNPWTKRLEKARRRCNDKNGNRFHRYGGRGIKCLLSIAEAKVLWFRDGADKMVKPTLDRIDNDGNYELGNCRFVEQRVNSTKTGMGSHAVVDDAHCVRGHRLTPENTFSKPTHKRGCRTCKNESNQRYRKRILQEAR